MPARKHHYVPVFYQRGFADPEGLQFTRVPSFARSVSSTFERTMKEMMKVQFANVDRARQALNLYTEQTGEILAAAPESFVESIAQQRFRLKATERPFLEHMMRLAGSLAEFVAESDWTTLVAPSTSGFITSDSAFVSVPPRDADLATTGSVLGCLA
jgi:hypothetical protein